MAINVGTLSALLKLEDQGVASGLDQAMAGLKALPERTVVEVIADATEIDAAGAAVNALPTSYLLDVGADAGPVESVRQTVSSLPDSHSVMVNADAGQVESARGAITALPDSHEVDVQVDTSDADAAVGDLRGELAGLASAFTVGAALASFSSIEDAVVGTQVAVGGLVDESTNFEAVLRGIPSYLGAFNETQPVVRDIVAGMQGIAGVDLSTTGLSDLATQALTLARTLDVDVNEAIGAVTAMMTNKLAPDAQTAFDMIYSASKQLSGPARDELVSALTEYSVFFGHLGISGAEAMNMILAASDGSIQSIDKAGDAVKEFSIRAIDGSEASQEALASLVPGYEELTAKIAEGGDGAEAAYEKMIGSGRQWEVALAEGGGKARVAMGEIIDAILAMEDPLEQNKTAVALFGTTVEDLGGVTGLDKLREGMEATTEPIASLTEDSQVLAGTFSGEMATAMQTVSDLLGGLGEKLAPVLGWFNDLPAPIQTVVLGVGLLTAGLIALGVVAPLVTGGMTAVAAGLAAVGIGGGTAAAGTTAAGVAATGASVGFWALTASMAPILLAVAAVIGIVALLVIHFDTLKRWAGDAIGFVIEKFVQFKNWAGDRIADVIGFLANLWGKFGEMRDRVAGVIADVIGIFARLLVGAKEKFGAVVDWVRGIPSAIWDVFSGAGSWLIDAGRRIISGLIVGVAQMAVNLKRELQGITRMIPSWKGPPGVDAKLLFGTGQLIMGGLEAGMASRFSSLQSTLGGFTADLALPAGNVTVPTARAAAAGGGGGVTFMPGSIVVQGNVTSERDLITTVQRGINEANYRSGH